MQHKIINSNVEFVNGDAPMQDVVKTMIEKNISSVLVLDEKDEVIGIVTERDIVHKFTLLDMGDKLSKTVRTLMSRPVLFAQVDHLPADIVKLHLTHKVRHFPVLGDLAPLKKNVVGIISITDVARAFLAPKEDKKTAPAVADQKGKEGHRVAVLAHDDPHSRHDISIYQSVFKKLQIDVVQTTDIKTFMNENPKGETPLLFDMDHYSQLQLSEIIPLAKKYAGHLFLATSQRPLQDLFKKYLDNRHQEIFMKPIDFSYLGWRLSQIWAEKK